MIRKIIRIDEEKCDGCGLCAEACHEGAIAMMDGKAKLLRDDYCDGLGDCLPVCRAGAISFEEREAAEYDEAAVKARVKKPENAPLPCGCPGSNTHAIERGGGGAATASRQTASQLAQWPVQIKLVPVNAPFFENANLLISADCSAYAYDNFHSEFMRNKITLIGCPKLDEGDYSEKLAAILKNNNVNSVTVTRMEVPCCGGIESVVKKALKESGKTIPWRVVTLSIDGKILG